MAYKEFVTGIHRSTKRDYVQRVIEHDKAACAEVAKRFGEEYWDGDRKYGYGGYHYDGRWRPVAEALVQHYGIKPGHSILDIGCGKGFLLYELSQIVPDLKIAGVDVSAYAIEHAKPEVRPFLQVGVAEKLPFDDKSFDFAVSINVFHNLKVMELNAALAEMERVARLGKYIVVESFRNEREKVNLLYWQLTCRSFYGVDEWQWVMDRAGYSGDYGCIYFE
ncbi:class I SAM-dependent methyltransferase [Dongia sp.]|uniref:class I SAM-dependent methyltransferase n=1 Tax=Dongia sp. TaxID=1977262 RepID=UPI0035B3CBB2